MSPVSNIGKMMRSPQSDLTPWILTLVSRWQWQIIGTKLNTKQTSSKQYQIFTSFEIFFKESSMNVLESVLPPNLPNLGSLLSVLFIKCISLNYFKKSLLNNQYSLRKSIKLFYLLTVSIKRPNLDFWKKSLWNNQYIIPFFKS